jgi:hypothetical protein
VASRQQAANRAGKNARTLTVNEGDEYIGDYEISDAPPARQPGSRSRATPRPSSKLLEALKEELFELEVERKQGHISQEEYEKAKSALDQTLERALKREAQKA